MRCPSEHRSMWLVPRQTLGTRVGLSSAMGGAPGLGQDPAGHRSRTISYLVPFTLQLQLCHYGRWRKVLVDDLFPCTDLSMLAYTKSARRQVSPCSDLSSKGRGRDWSCVFSNITNTLGKSECKLQSQHAQRLRLGEKSTGRTHCPWPLTKPDPTNY